MNGYRSASYAGFFFIIIGLVLIGYGGKNLMEEMKLTSAGLKTKGKVVELVESQPYRRAMVEFKTAQGQKVTFLDKLFWNNRFNKYTVGQEVEVIYNPASPIESATINDFFQRNTGPWFPVILGVIALIVGLIWRKSMLKKAKKLDAQLSGAEPFDYNPKSSNKVGIILVVVILVLIAILVIPFLISGGGK